MRAYLGIKYHADNRNQAVVEALSAALADCGVATSCVARDLERWGAVRFEARDLMRRTFDLIEGCDFVVTELSEKGVGLGIEAGYAYARKVPVVTVAKRGSDISETLKGISSHVLLYEEVSDLSPIFADLFSNFERARRGVGTFQPDAETPL